MKKIIRSFAAVVAFAGVGLVSNSAQAQNAIGGAVQQGRGAYVQKNDRADCMTNTLLGVPALAPTACVTMTQVKFMVTPSGNSSSVWKGTVPTEARPAQRVVFNSTFTEPEGQTKGKVYNTVSVIEPSGDVTLTLTSKGNDKSKK